MTSLIGPVSALVSHFVPSESMTVRMNVGMLVGEVMRGIATFNVNALKQWMPRFFNSHSLTVNHKTCAGKRNPVFDQLHEYVLDRYMNTIHEAQVEPKQGNLQLLMVGGTKITDTFQNQSIQIMFYDKFEEPSKDKSEVSESKQFILTSRKLTVEQLKQYVNQLCNPEKIGRTLYTSIDVYNVSSSMERSFAMHSRPIFQWEKNIIKTNKTLDNTIFSDEVIKHMFDDVDWFIRNESWYTTRGMTHKRGYLLYGHPGTGKTSVAKIIANKYNIPIFSLDLQMPITNAEFVKLITDIACLTQGRYILSIEDIDRFPMFYDKSYHLYRNACDLSVQCFLNFLDGIIESHGRICIFSCNDIEMLNTHHASHALFRPGRIDRKIEFKPCDKTQLCKLVRMYYDQHIDVSSIQSNLSCTPAQFINIMTKYSYEDVLRILQAQHIPADLTTEITKLIQPSTSDSLRIAHAPSNKKPQKPKTPIQRLQHKQRELNRMDRMIQQALKKTEVIRDQLIVQYHDISEKESSTFDRYYSKKYQKEERRSTTKGEEEDDDDGNEGEEGEECEKDNHNEDHHEDNGMQTRKRKAQTAIKQIYTKSRKCKQ